VTLIPAPSRESPKSKIKKQQTGCNSRGEFVFRLPPVSMRYTVRAAAKGYSGQEKSIEVEGEARVDVTFSLHEESK